MSYNYHSRTKEPIVLTIIRILLACVFIFSGLTKAVDPIASAIKMEEYFTSFGMDFMHPLCMFIAVCMNIAEFLLGFMLLFRIKVKLVAWGYLLFMTFFLLLTAWLALAEHLEIKYGYDFGVVKDCGCFGAAIKLNNFHTFLKNVGIIIPTLIVFICRDRIPDIRLTELGKWCFAGIGCIIVCLVQFISYRHLPIVDFSDWAKGKNVAEAFIEKPAVKEIVYKYLRLADSTTVEMSSDEMMEAYEKDARFDEKYEYLDRIDSTLEEAVMPEIPGFNMVDSLGGDHSIELIQNDKSTSTFIVFMHDLEETNEKGIMSPALKLLADSCMSMGVDFVGITNSPQEYIDAFVSQYNITFPIYSNAIDPVKGPFMVRDAIRSNPGLMQIKNGIVVGKWSWRDFPAIDKVEF